MYPQTLTPSVSQSCPPASRPVSAVSPWKLMRADNMNPPTSTQITVIYAPCLKYEALNNQSTLANFTPFLKDSCIEGLQGIKPVTLLTDWKDSQNVPVIFPPRKLFPNSGEWYLCSLPWWTSAGLSCRCVCVSVLVCMCRWEREREREIRIRQIFSQNPLLNSVRSPAASLNLCVCI